MSRDTLANAKQELRNLLAPGGVPAAASVGLVMRIDGPLHYAEAGKATVTVATGGMGPTEWTATVRVYTKADVDPESASVLADAAMVEVDALIEKAFGRQVWRGPDFDRDLKAYVAACDVQLFREDF